MTRWGAALVIAICAAACAHERPRPAPAPTPKVAAPPRPRHVTVSPPDWYWEPVFVDAPADTKRIDLPVTNDDIARVEGAVRLWDDIGELGRERLRRDGVVVLGPAAGEPLRWHMGAFYEEQREKRVPYVITLDALFSLVHTSLTRALAEIEQREIAPLVDAMLARIDTRLGAEQKTARFEVAGGYRLARGVVAVARLLVDEKYVPAADIAAVVREEERRIDVHAGVSTSPLLGVPIDYGRFAGSPRGASSYRVLTWLTAAPFALVARTEARGARLDVGGVRHHARAAMLLARLADRDVDPMIHEALSRIARLSTFVWGPSDDLTPLALGDVADAGGIDLAKPDSIANVARVDKLRSLARAAHTPALFDGSGGAGAGGVGMRLLGSHASVDTTALAASASSGKAPSTLALDAWFRAGPPDASKLHASIHGSLLDALIAWSSPPEPRSRARFESVLASWSLVRHASSSFARTKAPAPPGPREIRVSGAPLIAFVAPEPEVVARLLATVRQARRGLTVLGPMVKASPADALLGETEDIVKVALRAAEREARDEPLTAEDGTALAAIPSRIASVENDAAVEGGPYAAVIHVDPAANRALVTATGAIEPAVLLAREPATGRIVLAVGAHLAHFEAAAPMDQLEGAAPVLERRIREGKAARASWTEGFRLAR